MESQNIAPPYRHTVKAGWPDNGEDLAPQSVLRTLVPKGHSVDARRLVEDAALSEKFDGIVGSSAPLIEVLDLVRIVAPTDATVLIGGETGTGKEQIAVALHAHSKRRGGPFVKLNCVAIPLDLLESELFGHEKGAFTGAIAQRIGRFQLADKGTLFLDEVGDIPLALQPKLLRVLQEQEFERLGSTRTHRVDVRLVAATNRDLMGMVKRGEFRSDLYYRLNVFPVLLPPLRERREDIPALVGHFAELFGYRIGRQIEHIPPSLMSALSSYHWPGNIRELKNLIERAVILSNNGVLHDPLPRTGAVGVFNLTTNLKDSERALILQTLQAVGWVIGGAKGAAARLGLKRTTLISRMSRMGISRPPFQSRHDVIRSAALEMGSTLHAWRTNGPGQEWRHQLTTESVRSQP
jgi:formate hydrogenlyase transcriptional activator